MAAVPIARWIRRNLLVIAAAAATMAAVVIASLLILDVADREDTLRDAQTNLAELAPEAVALRAQPVNVVDRGVAARSDVAVSHGLRTAAIAAARATRQSWDDDSRTASILATTERTVALNGTVVTRAVAGDFAGARRALRRLVPTGESLSTQVALARRSLQREIDRRQGEVLGAVLLIAGLAGLGLVGLMAGVVTARRRRARSEAEKGDPAGEREPAAGARPPRLGHDHRRRSRHDGALRGRRGARDARLRAERGRGPRSWSSGSTPRTPPR